VAHAHHTVAAQCHPKSLRLEERFSWSADLGTQLRLRLDPARITVPGGARAEIDGAGAARIVFVECRSYQGPPKSAQRHKVLADALNLAWISRTLTPAPRLILCMAELLAAAPFPPDGRSWAAHALHDLGIAGQSRRDCCAARKRADAGASIRARSYCSLRPSVDFRRRSAGLRLDAAVLEPERHPRCCTHQPHGR
jgi:hypothetical protein